MIKTSGAFYFSGTILFLMFVLILFYGIGAGIANPALSCAIPLVFLMPTGKKAWD